MKIQTISFFAQIIKHIQRLEFMNIIQKHQADRFFKCRGSWTAVSESKSSNDLKIGMNSVAIDSKLGVFGRC